MIKLPTKLSRNKVETQNLAILKSQIGYTKILVFQDVFKFVHLTKSNLIIFKEFFYCYLTLFGNWFFFHSLVIFKRCYQNKEAVGNEKNTQTWEKNCTLTEVETNACTSKLYRFEI